MTTQMLYKQLATEEATDVTVSLSRSGLFREVLLNNTLQLVRNTKPGESFAISCQHTDIGVRKQTEETRLTKWEGDEH